jgi:hypothetical protein
MVPQRAQRRWALHPRQCDLRTVRRRDVPRSGLVPRVLLPPLLFCRRQLRVGYPAVGLRLVPRAHQRVQLRGCAARHARGPVQRLLLVWVDNERSHVPNAGCHRQPHTSIPTAGAGTVLTDICIRRIRLRCGRKRLRRSLSQQGHHPLLQACHQQQRQQQ